MNNKNNKFEIVHHNLIKFCSECTLNKKGNCIMYDEKCERYNKKYQKYYFDILYPSHPCKNCFVFPMCRDKDRCEKYWHFCYSRWIAECEINNNVVFFSKEKIPMVSGAADLITEEYLKSDNFFRTAVDFQVTIDYTVEIKSAPIYSELLSTMKQYLKYAAIHSNDHGETEFIEKFYRL